MTEVTKTIAEDTSNTYQCGSALLAALNYHEDLLIYSILDLEISVENHVFCLNFRFSVTWHLYFHYRYVPVASEKPYLRFCIFVVNLYAGITGYGSNVL